MTRKATQLTTSGTTGLTLPGMIDEPGWIAGRLISARPARGPEVSRMRSLAILESLTAVLFKAEEYTTKPCCSHVAAIMSSAITIGFLVRLASSFAHASG